MTDRIECGKCALRVSPDMLRRHLDEHLICGKEKATERLADDDDSFYTLRALHRLALMQGREDSMPNLPHFVASEENQDLQKRIAALEATQAANDERIKSMERNLSAAVQMITLQNVSPKPAEDVARHRHRVARLEADQVPVQTCLVDLEHRLEALIFRAHKSSHVCSNMHPK